MCLEDLKELLEAKYEQYNHPDFIENDPISIPHAYSRKQDIEITGLWSAVLSWGQRTTIINSCQTLFRLMDNDPYNFILNHQPKDLKSLTKFKHRTFNATDTLYFIEFFKDYYSRNNSLETAFSAAINLEEETVKNGLIDFHKTFFSLPDFPERTKKHIATPARKSACKRLNMFLRWMVRKDSMGVDFGIWDKISPHQLVCPCDVHVERVARRLGILRRKQLDWQAVEELTQNLKKLDPSDPVRYDYALFGIGIEERRLFH